MIKTILTSFVLVGNVDSLDDTFATVELNSNPALAEPAIAVMAITAFPCEIKEGDRFYIVKYEELETPFVVCHEPLTKGLNFNVEPE